MSQSSNTSGSSLLHLHRPPHHQNARPQLSVVVQDDVESSAGDSICSSPTSSIFHSATAFCPPPAGPSMKLDPVSTSRLQQPQVIRRTSEDRVSTASTTSISPERAEGCLNLLRSVQPSIKVAKPRSEWQPDADTAFCNEPSCSTMFTQTTLSFGPRRHHCRLCGLIFCSTHSTGRMPLHTTDGKNRHILAISRVCDDCYSCPEEDDSAFDRRLSDTTPSLVNSETSAKDDIIAEPENSSYFSLGRSLSTSAVPDVAKRPSLAPIEEWMDRSGVLSLYPLAVKPSHSRRSPAAGPVPSHAAPPLFAPTNAERRFAQEKEQERLSSRRRRNVRLWISTPAGSDDEEADRGHQSVPVSPTRPTTLATGARSSRAPSPVDWSTF